MMHPQIPLPASDLAFGDFSLDVVPGGLGTIVWRDVEVLRGVTCMIRDRNWGSYRPEDVQTMVIPGSVPMLDQSFSVADGRALIDLRLTARAEGWLDLQAGITAHSDLVANRAGLVILHPILGVAGTPLVVTDPQQGVTETRFPTLISPAQPVSNIAALSHRIADIAVQITFSGEVFEMEDQRNWSDASFKTYCRPLAWPYPYELKAGETIRQTISLRLTMSEGQNPRKSAPARQTSTSSARSELRLPEVLLAVENDWVPQRPIHALSLLGKTALLLRLHPDENGLVDPSLVAAVLEISDQVDVEVVLPDGGIDILPRLAEQLYHAGLAPRRVIALPQGWMRSVQPGTTPSGARPDVCASAVAAAFPEARIGVGALTNFTELNRSRPPVGLGDYVTHANTAIVHAADDTSVWQTLETLPHIFQSAREIAVSRAYRLGLVSIAMRTNPYGAALADNPLRQQVAMAGDDPRQSCSFAAAYVIGVLALGARHDVEAVALAAPLGRFGVVTASGLVFPIFHALRALNRFSGKVVFALNGLAPGLFGFELSNGDIVIANCTAKTVEFCPGSRVEGRLLADGTAGVGDPDWLDNSETVLGDRFDLPPASCLFARKASTP